MPRLHKNLKMQMHCVINSKLKIGQSKTEAKKEYRAKCVAEGKAWNPSKAEGIHSITTAESYRQTINEFSAWMKENHAEIKMLNDVSKDICYEYLKQREANGCSAWSVSKDMSALNKVFDHDLNKRDGGLASRRFEDITRSRNEAKMDSHYNPDNYAKHMLMTESFGCRRESICGGSYQLKEGVSLYQTKEGDVYCRMIEKGGRFREAPCLEANKEQILATFNVPFGTSMDKEQFIEAYNSASGGHIFNEYTKHIDNHALRAEYATNLYIELEAKATSNEEWRGYNKEALAQVSQALGHNRLEIALHYVRVK